MIATRNVQSFIGGKFRDSRAQKVDPIPNPATGQTIASLPHSTKEEIDEAVAAAKKAFPAWSETPVPERAQVMFRFKALLEANVPTKILFRSETEIIAENFVLTAWWTKSSRDTRV